jgi:phosphoglycerate kinase
MINSITTVLDWHNKKVLVREDLNVPQDATGQITDDTRIKAALPTLAYLLERGATVILLSHLGRPKGEKVAAMTLEPVAIQLQKLMPDTMVTFIPEMDWQIIQEKVNASQPGQLLVLENIRFYPGEEKNDPELAKQLAALADIFVHDAFGTSHRAHASTEGVARLLPPVAGLLMQKEIEALSMVLNSKTPITALIGGSKVSTKITVLENLLPRVKHLVIGGGMIFTFLRASGFPVGNSLVEEEFIPLAASLLAKSGTPGNARIVLPDDLVVASAFSAGAEKQTVLANAIPEGWMGLDIGEKTIASITTLLEHSETVLWNGPMGVFEFPRFATGTRSVAEVLARLTKEKAGHFHSILGGGDTVASIEQFGIPPASFTHVSTGGGASLEFLEGKTLPGIAVLETLPHQEPVKTP